MRIGIDFGTTHTSAAFYDGAAVRFVPLDEHNPNVRLLRSLLYIDRAHTYELGMRAAQTFLERDTGRPVVYVEKVVGTLENTVARQSRSPLEPDGPIHLVYDVVIDEDVGMQGRLLQSIKTALRSQSYTGTNIFGRFYSVEELIAIILGHVRKKAEAHLEREVAEVTLGRPVKFSDDPTTERSAVQRLAAACRLAGFQQVEFMQEPVAAALFYLRLLPEPQTILVFDFGGGTLDLTVMHAEGLANYEILSTHGVLVGGDDLDSAVMRGKVAPTFGTTSHIDTYYDDSTVIFPHNLAEQLERWQTIPILSRPQNLALIGRARQYGDNPGAFAALECLVTRNYGFALFERIEAAKRSLSECEQATIHMQAETIDLAVNLSRQEFNLLIGDELAEARTAVRAAVEIAGLRHDAIDVVVMTGGSSSIPAFQQMLTREFAAARIIRSGMYDSVTGGLALAAHLNNREG
jgi:hypothetical chaperone protein